MQNINIIENSWYLKKYTKISIFEGGRWDHSDNLFFGINLNNPVF